MPTADALIGRGMPAGQAGELADNPTTFLGSGTSQSGATLITSKTAILNSKSSNTAYILPGTSQDGKSFFSLFYLSVATASTASAAIYPPTSGTINALAANSGVTVAAGHAFLAFQTSAGVWVTVPNAPT